MMADPSKIFLSFQYPEVKDLCKSFLTLIAGILVFSVTFSEKIVDFQRAPLYQRLVLLVCWALLMISFALCGLGLYTIFIAGEAANGAIIYDYGYSFIELARRSYLFLDLSGVSFVLALAALVGVAIPKVFVTELREKEE